MKLPRIWVQSEATMTACNERKILAATFQFGPTGVVVVAVIVDVQSINQITKEITSDDDEWNKALIDESALCHPFSLSAISFTQFHISHSSTFIHSSKVNKIIWVGWSLNYKNFIKHYPLAIEEWCLAKSTPLVPSASMLP
jgi:hypothetical protein